MKKNLLIILCFAAFSITNIQAQNVPNGGFENWAGNPAGPVSWLANNIPTVATPITQTTPSHAGAYALKGEVVTSGFGDMVPLLQSIDLSGNGFAVTQAYSTLSFYYKTGLSGPHALAVLLSMSDAGSNLVGSAVMMYSGNVSTYTLASIPIFYSGTNPVECTIQFTIYDTTGGNPVPGNYFIIDDVGLSGLASVQEPAPALSIENVYPNPVKNSVTVHYNLNSKSDVQFRLLNIEGKATKEMLIPETSPGKHEAKLDVSSLPAGFYILRMKTNQGITFNHVLIAR